MDITVSENISYCVGVERTLQLVERLLQENPDQTYFMLGEIVHNEFVINDLKSRGLKIVHNIKELPEGARVIIQSHGVAKSVYEQLEKINARIIDATCSMVKAIHKKIIRLARDGYFPVIIGKNGHDEVRGIAGQVRRSLIVGNPDEVQPELFSGLDKLGIVVQSTFVRSEALSIVNRIRDLVNDIRFEDTICRPTTERQEEIRKVRDEYDYIVIVGSRTSANTKHLYKLAQGKQAKVFLVDDPDQIPRLSIPLEASVFVTSGASTPLDQVETVIRYLYSR
jgi:4-hydroxy-3-methylbut-2-enyl diphosphate reductase